MKHVDLTSQNLVPDETFRMWLDSILVAKPFYSCPGFIQGLYIFLGVVTCDMSLSLTAILVADNSVDGTSGCQSARQCFIVIFILFLKTLT